MRLLVNLPAMTSSYCPPALHFKALAHCHVHHILQYRPSSYYPQGCIELALQDWEEWYSSLIPHSLPQPPPMGVEALTDLTPSPRGYL